jgi:hypothetical protein
MAQVLAEASELAALHGLKKSDRSVWVQAFYQEHFPTWG